MSPNRLEPTEYFVHEPLPTGDAWTIRLVTIIGGPSEAPINCQVFHTALRPPGTVDGHASEGNGRSPSSTPAEYQHEIASPDYEALSYTWGDPTTTTNVTLNGCLFSVTANLESALHHLRHEETSRTLWIDAICLNQVDNVEKEHQIPYMHVIYQQAKRVIVWLGDASIDSDLAIAYIREIHSYVEPGKESEISDTNHFTNWPISLFPRAPFSHDDVSSAFAFYRLLSRPWWRRAWIVQEISFAQEVLVQCGRSVVSWTQMRVALHKTRLNHVMLMAFTDILDRGKREDSQCHNWTASAINNALGLLYDRERVLRRNVEPLKLDTSVVIELSWSLGVNKGRLCQRPHDCIYSVLGIAGKSFRDKVQLDYNQTPDMHNRVVVRAFISATNSLDVILHSQHSVWLTEQSSWAPNWGRPERVAVLHCNGQSLKHPMRLSPGNVDFSSDLSHLHVKGRIIDTITAVALEFEQLLDPEQPFYGGAKTKLTSKSGPVEARERTWWEFKAELGAGQIFYPALTRLPATSPLWKRHLELFLGVVAMNWYPSAQPYFQRQWNDSPNVVAEHAQFKDLEEFWDLLVYLFVSRTICTMLDSRLVVAPDFTEVGDIVAMLAGCSSPVILRKKCDGSFMLIGDAYVLGLDDVDVNSLCETTVLNLS